MSNSAPTPDELLGHTRFVRSLASYLVRDRHDAEDVAQATLLAELEQGRGPKHRGWLRGTARNLARMQARGEGRRRRREAQQIEPSRPADPGAIAEQLEVQRRVVDAVAGLGEAYRTTIVLRYFHDETPAQIAGLLEVPVETVKTRLARAHTRLRETLDRGAGGRAGWAVPLTSLAKDAGAAPVSTTIGAMLMNAKATWIVLPLLGALIGGGVTAFVLDKPDDAASGSATVDETLQARVDELARENHSLREQLRTSQAASGDTPTLSGQGDGRASDTTAKPAPLPDAQKTPEASNTPNKQDGVKGLAALDWKKWVPVLMKYGELGVGESLDGATREQLSAFLGEVNQHLDGQRWETATDLFRAPKLATQIALAAAEHAGAKLSEEQRRATVKALESSLTEDMASITKKSLRAEQMAAVLRAVANAHTKLAKATSDEHAAGAAKLIDQLLREPGWSTMHLGSVGEEEFLQLGLQLWSTRAALDDHEKSEATVLIKDLWTKSRTVIDDGIRAHGEAAVHAALREQAGDTQAMAAARSEASFGRIQSTLHADLATTQAAADRAFFDLWKQIPKERQQAFDEIEPLLVLFVPN